MAMAGDTPLMYSTSGFSILPRNCRAYELRLSTYILCPSANKVSNAREDLPEPESPVTTTSLFLGMATLRFLRLLTRAFLIIMNCLGSRSSIRICSDTAVFCIRLQRYHLGS